MAILTNIWISHIAPRLFTVSSGLTVAVLLAMILPRQLAMTAFVGDSSNDRFCLGGFSLWLTIIPLLCAFLGSRAARSNVAPWNMMVCRLETVASHLALVCPG